MTVKRDLRLGYAAFLRPSIRSITEIFGFTLLYLSRLFNFDTKIQTLIDFLIRYNYTYIHVSFRRY